MLSQVYKIIILLILSLVFVFYSFLSNYVYAESFSMVKGPVQDFADWTSRKTGKNIILGLNVDADVTFMSHKVDDDDVLLFFTYVMEAYGFKTLIDGDNVSVVTQDIYQDRKESSEDLDKDVPIVAKLVTLNNALSSDISPNLSKLLQSMATKKSSSAVQVVPGNKLLLLASQDSIDVAMTYIDELDQPKMSILVEAIIFEVSRSEVDEIGTDFTLGKSSSGLFASLKGSDLVDLSTLPSALAAQFLRADSFSALIHAIQTSDNSNLLSHPKLAILDGLQGRINVGQNVPFVTANKSSEDSETVVQEIERKDVGTTLTITPKIINGDLISLDVYQESSNVTTDTYASDIITNTRSIKTSIRVAPGQVVLLGGLISDDEIVTETKLPLLGDLPGVGKIFRSKKTEESSQELNVFIRVRIV